MKKQILCTPEQYAAIHALIGQTTGTLFAGLYTDMGKRVRKESLPGIDVYVGGHVESEAYRVILPFIRLTVKG